MHPLAMLACGIFMLGCTLNDNKMVPSTFHRNFFRLSIAEQIADFQEHDVRTQYELLLVGNQVVHPPAIYLAREFAKGGKSILPFLTTKLKMTRDEETIRDIVATLTEMYQLDLYDIPGDLTISRLMEERVASMRGRWKPVVQRMVNEMVATATALRGE